METLVYENENENEYEYEPQVLADMNECAAVMVAMFRAATTTVTHSTFVLSMDSPLPGQPAEVTMRSLVHEAGARGVRVRLLLNPSDQYGNGDIGSLRASLAGVAEVRQVFGNGRIPEPLARVFGARYSNHHQKFLCVDDTGFMLGGVDVHPCRAGWLQLNRESPPYYWHEIAVLLSPPPGALVAWTDAAWAGDFVTPPPRPLVRGESEHAAMLHMIAAARTLIHMEAQVCISTGSTHNRVLSAVVERVASAWRTKDDPFRFILLVNTYQPDEHPVVSAVTTATLHWSRRMLYDAAAKLGVPLSFVNERVFVGTLEYQKTHIKIHTNLTIQDGHTMVRSSANLTDRSLGERPCDNELGVVISGEPVAQLLQTLWGRYFQAPGGVWLPVDAFELMRRETGLVRAVRFHPGHDTLYMPTGLVDVAMRALHALPVFGGRKKIEWSVET